MSGICARDQFEMNQSFQQSSSRAFGEVHDGPSMGVPACGCEQATAVIQR